MAASENGGGDGSSVSKLKALPSPWSKIVRGDLESISAGDPCSIPSSSSSASDRTPPTEIVVTENSISSEQSSDEQQIKPVWKKLCNAGDIVIGGDDKLWPGLLESSKISSKEVAAAAAAAKCASSSSSSKSVSNGSTRVSQGNVNPNSTQKQGNRSNPNHTSKHGVPSRSKPTKRSNGGNGGGKPTQNGPSPSTQPPPSSSPSTQPPTSSSPSTQRPPSSTPPPPPPFPPVRYSHGNFRSFVNGPPPPPPPGTLPYTARTMPVFPPILPNGFRSSSWRSPAGGPYHNGPGPRRFERSQVSNGRDLHMHHQIPPQRGFMPHLPPGSPVFIPPPPPVRSFTGPMAYNDMRPSSVYLYPSLHPDALRNMHFYPYTQPHPMGLSSMGPLPLPLILLSQVEYYFSDENLAKDKHLKLNMDEQGWVPIVEIANFPRIKSLTNDISAMEEALRSSVVVEVKEGKIRRRNDWNKYVIHTGQGSTMSNSQSHIYPVDNELATSLQSLALDEGAASNQITVESHPANDEGIH